MPSLIASDRRGSSVAFHSMLQLRTISIAVSIAQRLVFGVVVVLAIFAMSQTSVLAAEVPGTLSDSRPVVDGETESSFTIDYLTVQWRAPDVVMDNYDESGLEPFGAVRFQHVGGWGPWIPFTRDGAEAPGQWASSLVPAKDADTYQVRGIPDWAIAPTVAVLNTTDGPPVEIAIPPGDAQLTHAGPAVANCLSRAEWGADESLRYEDGDINGNALWPPSFYPVQIITVHHTADWNGTDDPAALVRATYYNHAVINGWGDIAYNYLIDESGQVYEGRWSGSDSAGCASGGDGSGFAHDANGLLATGGHTAYHNQANVGIALLGLFADETEFDYPSTVTPTGPTDAAVSALENLLAGLVVRHDLNPLGTVDYYNPVWDTLEAADTISGHRDFRATACPGAFLYEQIVAIREAVSEQIGQGLIQVTIDPLVLEGNVKGGYSGELKGVEVGNSGGEEVTLTNTAPDLLPVGDTGVVWTATTSSGTVETALQTVQVRDTVAPSLTVPEDRYVTSSNGAGVAVSFSVTATDVVDADAAVSCSPESGSVFAVGGTTVSCSSSDDSGNTKTVTFLVVVYDPDPFTDDDGSVFEADIAWMAAVGITKGCNPPANTRFCPENSVTRAQMAAFISRALNLSPRAEDPFSDDDGSIFEADIERLAAAGITKGCNPPANDRFCPDSIVTREQMAAFLVRALGYNDDGGGDLFSDDDGSIFEADIDRLGTAGVTKGCNPPNNTRFCPDNKVTRGQMAAFLHRALG